MKLPTPARTPTTTPQHQDPDADALAVLSFVLGLLGLLVLNLVLGPCALALGALALTRGTTRRTRACLGLALGTADLLLLAALITADHTVSRHI